MANINSLMIGKTLSTDPRVTIKKGFMGFGAKGTYNATQSNLKAYRKEYDIPVGEQIYKIMENGIGKTNATDKFQQKDLGTFMLEVVVSDDNQFLALRLYRFDFSYKPVTELKIYEGKDAEALSSLF